MTTLPRIAPQETQVSISPEGITKAAKPSRRQSRSVIKTSTGLSKSWDGSSLFPWVGAEGTEEFKVTPKPDPLRPVREKTFTLESTENDYSSEVYALQKKREQYHQFHRSWMRPFYGSKTEQEEYRASIRGILKNQIDEKQNAWQQFMTDKVQESEAAVAFDKDCIDKDFSSYQRKALYLRKFRDGNKQLIEEREQLRRMDRIDRQNHERELLKYNPINWSQTLR